MLIEWNKLEEPELVEYDFSKEDKDENNDIIINSSSESEEDSSDKEIDGDEINEK